MGYQKDEAPAAAESVCNPLAGLPTPCRVREEPCAARPVCVLDVTPWDSLAQFLTLPELAWLCCASSIVQGALTLEEKEGDEIKKKMLAPVLVLKVETAEAELERVSLPNARTVRVWNYRSLNNLAEAVADAGGPHVLRSLERLHLKGCPLTPETISSFMVPVFSHAMLKHLNLEKNQVTDDMLCDLVQSGALDAGHLESINLRFNRISSRGVQALATSPCCQELKWVNLKMNQVGDDGAIALATMLEGNSTMSLLNLRRQTPPLTDRAAVAFARMLKLNSSLEQLRFRQNRITDDGAMALAAEVAGHVARLQAFRGIGARFELDLEQNRIKDAGACALLEALAPVSKAVRVELLIHGNWVKRDALAKAANVEDAASMDPRLSFESKAEGLLW